MESATAYPSSTDMTVLGTNPVPPSGGAMIFALIGVPLLVLVVVFVLLLLACRKLGILHSLKNLLCPCMQGSVRNGYHTACRNEEDKPLQIDVIESASEFNDHRQKKPSGHTNQRRIKDDSMRNETKVNPERIKHNVGEEGESNSYVASDMKTAKCTKMCQNFKDDVWQRNLREENKACKECFDSTLRKCLEGQDDISKELLKMLCKEIKGNEERESRTPVQIYPSYKEPNRWQPIIVVFGLESSHKIEEQYRTWPVVRRRFDLVDGEASEIALSDVAKDAQMDFDKMESIANAIREKNLPANHSNITLISACPRKKNKVSGEVTKEDCIAVHCLMKGYIPFGEEPLPKSLHTDKYGEVRLDVREGFCSSAMQHVPRSPSAFSYTGHAADKKANSYNAKLLMGTEIRSTAYPTTGTLGGFVNFSDGEEGFLTCAHVVCPECDTKADSQKGETVRQPATCSVHRNACSDLTCGKVEKCVFNCDSETEVSIDAAAVRVDKSKREIAAGKFVFVNMDELIFAGYEQETDLNNRPSYSGEIIEISKENIHHDVLKVGKQSGLTRGILNFIQVTSREPTKWPFTLPKLQNTSVPGLVTMYNQYEVCSLQGQGSRPFAIGGDSGALVFQDIKGDLKCLGMVVGVTSYNSSLVTPIKFVLEALDVTLCTRPT